MNHHFHMNSQFFFLSLIVDHIKIVTKVVSIDFLIFYWALYHHSWRNDISLKIKMLKIYLSKNNIKLISSKVELIIVSYGVGYFSLSESMIFFYQHIQIYIYSFLFCLIFFFFHIFSFGCIFKVIIMHWTHHDGDILLGLSRIQPASMKPAST